MKLLPQLIIIALLCPVISFGQTTDPAANPESGTPSEKNSKKLTLFEFLSQDPDITEVTLVTDMDSLMDNKFKNLNISSTYSYSSQGTDYTLKTKVSPRGKSRKMVCDMPPFLLDFSKDELKTFGVRKKHDKLKLVNFCRESKRYEYYLLREYLIYKMYNLFTENSFNVKLINATYKDAQNDIKPVTNYAFLIESTDEMASRNNAKEINKYETPQDSCRSFDFDVLCLFEYMISNTDWNVSLLHNIKLIRKKDTNEIIVVPYDFDYSGLVNADYAVPNPDYNQFGIRHRIYLGKYPTDEEMEVIIQLFKDKEDEIYNLINNFELLDKGWRKDMIRFLKKFYKDLNKPKKLKRKCINSQGERFK